ncbi:hypothetical protein BGX27_010935 [Mortierella sp. AM989]|nr:hypothetical protein BGX27_010935 [Mortierella sp. AM989]
MVPPTNQALAKQSCLPEECLSMVFRHLSHDRSALYALLLVSRQFFRLAVPILYRSPFRLLESKAESWSWSERTQRQVLLLQLFMYSVQIRQLDRAESRRQRRRQRQPESEDCSHALRPFNRRVKERGKDRVTAVAAAKSKRRQRWWTKRRLSSEEASFPSPHSTPSFSASTLSKKESNVTAVPENIQGKQTLHSRQQQPLLLNRDFGLNTPSPSLLHITEAFQCQSFWCDSQDDSQDAFVISRPQIVSNDLLKKQSHADIYLGPSRLPERCMKTSRDSFTSDDHYSIEEASSDGSFSDEDILHCSPDGGSRYSSDADEDDDSTSEDDVSQTDSIFSKGFSSLEPRLGPFGHTREIASTRNWTQTLHQQLRTIRGDSNSSDDDNHQKSPPNMTTRLMTDYLSHYIEHDHPRLVRVLPSIFPNLPAESFDQLLTSRSSLSATSPPDESPSLRYPVLNFFQSLQQSHKNIHNLRKAHSIRTMVERDMLHHSPQRIKSISLSASRIRAITHPPSRRHPSSKSESRSNLLDRSLVSPITSLISLLPTSPFSKTTPTPSSSPSSWYSSASSSTVFSSQSSHSTASSSYTADSISWSNVPQLCKLSHLYRIELYDIHHGIDVEAVVDFLRLQDRTYNSIREVKVGGPDDLGRSSHPDLIQVLQSLRVIKMLDMVEWREAITYLDQIPTKHLETLLLGNVRMTNMQNSEPSVPLSHASESGSNESLVGEEGENYQHPQIQALQRCRLLRELRMPVLIEGLFEWAVNERRQKAEATPTSGSSLYASSLKKTPPYWDHGRDPLIQLENVHLSGTGTGPLISTLINVVDAFRDSIQVLQSNSWMDSSETLTCCLNLSWTWCLPQLQVLDLQGEVAHRFRIQSLQYCPLLRVLRLTLPHYVIPATSLGLTGPNVVCQNCTCEGDGECNSCGLQLKPLSLADCFRPQFNRYTSHTISQFPTKLAQQRPELFPRLQELKLVGDWGLQDESLLGIAKTMPRLTRLSLLRCESEQLTARGLVCALPSLRLKGQGRLRTLEVSKAWQSELEAGIAGVDRYGDLAGSVTEGYSSLELLYQ